NLYGVGKTIKRSEFVTYLVRLMGWELVKPTKGSFIDNADTNKFYYSYIETALTHGVIKKDSTTFRPDAPITREEMSMMIVRTLGCDYLANQLNAYGKPFIDVTRNFGYILIGKDFGIIGGVGNNSFAPNSSATREQAAAMMIRMYDRLRTPLNELHAFYAISSASQADKIPLLDSASFGWARLEYDETSKQVMINTGSGTNEYYLPSGFANLLDTAQANSVSRQLFLAIKNQSLVDPATNNSMKLSEYVITHPEVRTKVIADMVALVNSISKNGLETSFDGIVSDFEGFKGDVLKQAYNAFLTELRAELDKTGKKLYVAVHPRGKPGQTYFDGYDYRTIGELADKVILMAHDYEATSLTDAEMQRGYTATPVTPIDEVYFALKTITDPVYGVKDIKKIWLQLSMDSAQWKLKDGKVINRTPYPPTYDLLEQRLLGGAAWIYSEYSQNPYITFTNTQDGTQNVIWYENQRSIAEKIKLAKMFGLKGLSVWRLGNIPEFADPAGKSLQMNIWQEIMQAYQ
ncbi:MAG: glycosyl hydrolase family 18 protein, partial [Clostridia bacterium]|nr:glycosyl hydrolase family 18 protein [Clostridia bacterium]